MTRAASREASPGSTGRPRRRAQSWIFTVVFAVLVTGTVVGFLVARDRAERTADRRAEQAAAGVAAALETEIGELASALAGSGAILATDGSLDADVFAAFAADLIDAEDVHGLTLLDVVPASDREEYEEETGRPIAVVEAGILVPAPPAQLHFPVVAVASGSSGGSEVGLDFGSDPTRGATLRSAVSAQEARVSSVVDLPTTNEPGLELVRPLIGGTAAEPVVDALVVADITIEDFAATARQAMRPGTEIALLEGAELIFGTEFDRRIATTSATAVVPGRSWTVVIGPTDEADLTPAWLVAAGGLAAVLAMAALMIATERHQRRLARSNALLTRLEGRSRAVQEVAGRLARALSGGEIVTALVDHLPEAVGAESAVLATVDDAGRLELLGPEDTTTSRSRYLEGGPESLVRTTMARGEPAWMSSPLAWRGDEDTATLAAGGSALALLPLAAEGVVGVLAVSYPRIRVFAEDEQALLQTVSILAARALARGRRYDSEHRTALAFQHAALPDELPDVDGLTFAARYRPAARQATVGGDWYDVLVLDERRVVLVVGDVVGHGLVAAAAMGRLRTAFQAIAPLSADPGAMLRTMSKQSASIPDSFCTTMVCAVVDLETGSMSWCRAGHPPPLALGRGDVWLLDDRGLAPLGVDPDAEPPVHTRALDPGDIIILYTDGIVERRGESIDDGFERLRIVADNLADLEPDEFSDALVEALVPVDEQVDDLAVLVFRFDGIARSSVAEPAGREPVRGAMEAPSISGSAGDRDLTRPARRR